MRRNGARIGRHVWINSLQVGDECLLDIGDETVIGAGVHMSGHTVERGKVLLSPIVLGPGTVVGVGSHVGIGVRTGAGTQIGSMSVVPKHAELEAETTYAGIPVRRLDKRSSPDPDRKINPRQP
jgi:acetyltransferase-like isoleucine patch superfamily enzyme